MLKPMTLEVVGDQRLACEGCENRVARMLKAIKGVERVRAYASNQRINVQFDPAVVDASEITERLKNAGYETRVDVSAPIHAV
jgi:copper chaperone